MTFGYGINPFGLSYPLLTRQALQKASPHRRIEVTALAVPGYSRFQGLELLRQEIDRLSPDLVIASFGFNDTESNFVPDTELLPPDWWRVTGRQHDKESGRVVSLTMDRCGASALWSERDSRTGRAGC